MVDLSDVLGGFLMVSQQGRLFALERIEASDTLDHFTPRPCPVSLDGLEPLIRRLRASPMALVIHPGNPPRSYFLTSLPAADRVRQVKVFQSTEEIVTESLNAGGWPLLHVGELQRAAVAARENATTLSVPVRQAELRSNLPTAWCEALHGVFIANLESPADKCSELQDHVARLRVAINRTMVDGWLSHCLWLAPDSGLIGRALPNREHVGFTGLTSDEMGVLDFRRLLARDDEGRLLEGGAVANVVPALQHGTDWTGPTVNIYDIDFRRRHHLDEHYSLHQGLRALSAIGAPVLEFQPGAIGRSIRVRLLIPAAAPESVAAAAVRRFPLRHLLWQTGFPR